MCTSSCLHLISLLNILPKASLPQLLQQLSLPLNPSLEQLNLSLLLSNPALHVRQLPDLLPGALQLVLDGVAGAGDVLEGEALLGGLVGVVVGGGRVDARGGLERGADFGEDGGEVGEDVEGVGGECLGEREGVGLRGLRHFSGSFRYIVELGYGVDNDLCVVVLGQR